ncbi:MAG: cytochrome ubiquinol oxidase subunit I [Alphaproteobacteria bacterium]|nr:MAG: cytochrome ubiquinol oxidase subunit I [Alphaproteobacteria bacterium]
MDPADPRRAAAVPVPGGGRRLDRFLAFRAAVLPLCRDHPRPRPLSDLRRVQGIAAIAVTRSRHLLARRSGMAFGTLTSASWILVVNSWMQTPAGWTMNEVGQFLPEGSWLPIIFSPSLRRRAVTRRTIVL